MSSDLRIDRFVPDRAVCHSIYMTPRRCDATSIYMMALYIYDETIRYTNVCLSPRLFRVCTLSLVICFRVVQEPPGFFRSTHVAFASCSPVFRRSCLRMTSARGRERERGGKRGEKERWGREWGQGPVMEMEMETVMEMEMMIMMIGHDARPTCLPLVWESFPGVPRRHPRQEWGRLDAGCLSTEQVGHCQSSRIDWRDPLASAGYVPYPR